MKKISLLLPVLLAFSIPTLLAACAKHTTLELRPLKEQLRMETPLPEETPTDPNAHEYVLNMSSHKFHLPDCSGAASMSEANRWDYTGTREEVLEMGYEPCGLCRP